MKANIRLVGRKSARVVLTVGLAVVRRIVFEAAVAASTRIMPVLSWEVWTIQLLGPQSCSLYVLIISSMVNPEMDERQRILARTAKQVQYGTLCPSLSNLAGAV